MLLATAGSNETYARTHGYAYRSVIGDFAPNSRAANFNRYYLLREELDRAHYDWVLWLDADAIIVDHRVRLDSIIDRSPEKLIIACRGAEQGDHDINNGVFLFNLRHSQAREIVDYCLRFIEDRPAGDAPFHDDQHVVHEWLQSKSDGAGRVALVQCYRGAEYNLFNYDGPFIRHVMREFGDFDQRLRELRRLGDEVQIASQRRESLVHADAPTDSKAQFRAAADSQEKSMSFQKDQRIVVACPAAYQELPLSSRWLLESSRRYGIELTLLGQGQPYPNHMRKVSLVGEYLREHPEVRYVLQVDVKDVVFCATLREMFFKYRSRGHAIVAAGERVAWPLESHGRLSPEVGTSFRYLNAGTIFATAEAWLDAWQKMQQKEARAEGRPAEQSHDGLHIFNVDQAAWSDLYVHGEADIVLDSTCDLFQALNQTDWSIAAANRDYVFESRRIVNRETGARPCLIHANAEIPVEPWGRYVLSPPTVWIWPLISRIRSAPLASLREADFVEKLLLELGLHDPIDGCVPDELLAYTGKGLSIWQRPDEFARYLTWLSKRPPIRSYLEIGVEAGGSFIATVEYLRRFHPLRLAVGVDPYQSPAVRDYVARTDGVYFVAGTQGSDELRALVNRFGSLDLILIDGDHSPDAVRADWHFARAHGRAVAFHDIAAECLPGVTSLWSEIRSAYSQTQEFIDSSWKPNLWAGIGVVDLAEEHP